MIITCKACNTSFNLDDRMLKPTGSKVRCSVCKHMFTAFPPSRPAPDASAEAVESGSDTVEDTKTASEPTPGTLEEGAKASFDDTDLDLALEEEPEEGALDTEIEDAVSDALDEERADDLSGEKPEADSSLEPETAEDSGATVIASLDDGDLELDLPLEDAGESGTATVIADLDEDDLDLSLDGPPEVAETIIADLDDDELDLDGEFSFETDGDVESVTVAADDDLPESMDDLDELDLTLDLDDSEPSRMEPADELPMLEDDLDLSSLEGLLKDDGEDESHRDGRALETSDAPKPGLELDDDATGAAANAADLPEETLEDLEFDLDATGGADSVDTGADDDGGQEIDLSEIEKMLEEPEAKGPGFSSVPEQDLDFDIEASLETEKWMAGSGEDPMLVKDEELDLSELEQVLDEVDADEADEASEDPELVLDLGDGNGLGAPETVAVDRELEFDLSDFEDDVPPTAAAEGANRESVDMELEFEVGTDSQAERTLEDEGLEETVAIPESKPKRRDPAPLEPVMAGAPPLSKPVPKPVKKGMSKSLIFLLVILLLGGVGYGTYYLLEKNGIAIPFLSDYLNPKVQDPGNLKLTTYDINSRFIDNANVGKLFVITGMVKNGYAENRSMITLEGKIYSTGKVVVNQEQVYCGNVMSDLELANLEWDKIKARLANRLGDNRSNVKIAPGETIPFMVVFSGLPDDLEEFTIEVTGSTTLK